MKSLTFKLTISTNLEESPSSAGMKPERRDCEALPVIIVPSIYKRELLRYNALAPVQLPANS